MNNNRILILNGPGLSDLSAYQGYNYGALSLEKIERECSKLCKSEGLELEFRQTDDDDQMFRWIAKDSDKFAGLIINPVGYSQAANVEFEMYRSSIRMIAHLRKPVVEVHITNIFNQGTDITKPLQAPKGEMGFICGLGYHGYLLAIQSVANKLRAEQN